MRPDQKKLIVAAVVLAGVTWWLATAPESPIRPTPPRPERPVLRFLARVAQVAAKFGLAALWVFEPAPPDADEVQFAHATIGVDGHQVLDNARW
jgi:hypothetical protein